MRYTGKNGVKVGRYVTQGLNTHSYVAAPETTWQDQVVVEDPYYEQFPEQLTAGHFTPPGSKAALSGCSACGGWGQAPDMTALMAASVPGGQDTPPASGSSLIVPLLIAGGALLLFFATAKKRG